MKIKILSFVLIVFILIGCSDKTVDSPELIDIEVDDEVKEDVKEPEKEVIDPSMILSPLDGLRYYPEELEKRPVAIALDNHPKARWQSGISQAEIVYEVEVEYPYTRYLCIFLAGEPKRVGPIRSARPYIAYYAMENDGIFVHVGGSKDAFSEIERLRLANIDGLYSGAMWRYNDTGKYAPHNMYTTLKSIRDQATSYGYREEASFEGYLFNEKSINLSDLYESTAAETVNIVYNDYNRTGYLYDEDTALYLRFKDGEKHIDELDKKQLTAKNIIIIETSKSVLDNEGRLYIETIGKGKGIYVSQGENIPITWEKSSEADRMKFYIDTEELKLNPGNIWIQVVNSLYNVILE